MSLLSKNVASLLASQVATWLVSVILLVIAPSRLGSEDFGRYQFVAAFIGFFTLVGSLGTYHYMVKQIARDHSIIGRLIVDAVELKIALGLVLVAASLALGWLFGYSRDVMLLIAIASVGMVAGMVNEVFVAGLAGMERMARAAFWTTVQVYIGNISAVVVALTSKSLVAYAAGFALAAFVPLVANFRAVRPLLHARTKVLGANWKAIIVGGVPLFMLAAVNLIYGTIDIPIIERISGTEVVGWYALALRWVGMPIFITTIVATAFLPRLSSYARQSLHDFARLTNRTLRMVTVITLPTSVGLAFVAADLLDLVYGNEYDNSASLMQILAIHVPITAIDTILATALIAADRQNRYLLVAIGAAVINPLLNIVAINFAQDRYGNGAIGAAIITVLTELFIMVWAIVLRSKGVMDLYTWKFFGRCLVAAGVMAIALALASEWSIFVRIALGAVVYAAASLALGTVSVDRARRVAKELGRSRVAAPPINEVQE